MKQYLLSQFNQHQLLFNNVLADFTDEETNQRLYNDTRINHVKYIAGHLLDSRQALGLLIGVPTDWKWNDLFAGRRQTRALDDISYPSIREIIGEWNHLYESLKSGLEALSTDKLEQRAPDPFGEVFENNTIFTNSIGGIWAFINHHQAYHIGQIGILRRGFGKEPMKYG